jgi:VWFA-related protein
MGMLTVIVALMFALSAAAQAHQNPDSPAPQNLPDARSTAKPTNPFPTDTAPAPANGPDQVPENTSSQPAVPAQQQTDEQGQAPVAPDPKMPPIKTIPPGSAPRQGSDRDELATFRVAVRSVVVPVTVKDLSGRRVDGLLPKDFTVLENGEPQKIVYFTSDPFPLSAAVVIDLGMSDLAVRKINQTLSALGGAFGQFDEVALYSYGNTVKQQQDFQPAIGEQIAAMLRRMRQTQRGREGGVPVVGGPMQSGPTINGKPADPGNPQVYTRPPDESRVLNDAILRAASDLSRRDRSRRKMLFVISDGREYGSAASYKDVLKFLLSNEISVYAVNVDSAALPGFKQLEGLNLPRTGSANILPKYASATGGQIFREFSQDAIEQAYSDLTSEARNQYTIGYTAPSGNAPTYRSIEVQVHRSGLKVYAKDGYYPLPPAKRAE